MEIHSDEEYSCPQEYLEHEPSVTGEAFQNYIQVVNKLEAIKRELKSNYGINIPSTQIAVVGFQSSGKSSLLENLCQTEFLPQGAGMMTKTPIIAEFVPSKTKGFKVDGQELSDANSVGKRIRQITSKVKGISDKPIVVQIRSPNLPGMTLVDLPGLIGKIKATLRNEGVKVKLGIVGVVNRCNLDETFESANAHETSIIQTNFGEMAHLHGVKYLAKTICKLQMQHILDSIPATMIEIEKNMKEQDLIIEQLGSGTVGNKQEILRKAVMNFAHDYKIEVEGSNHSDNIDTEAGSVIIKTILAEKLDEGLSALNSTSHVTNTKLKNGFVNSRGTEGHCYLTSVAFEKVAKRQIKEMLTASLDCLNEVYLVLRETVPKNCYPFVHDGEGDLFPRLQDEFLAEVCKLLDDPLEGLKAVEGKIRDYISTQATISATYYKEFKAEGGGDISLDVISDDEVNYIKKYLLEKVPEDVDANPEVPEGEAANPKVPEGPGAPDAKVKEGAERKLAHLRKVVNRYVRIVKGQVRDYIPKLIKRHLMYRTSKEIHDRMLVFYNKAVQARREEELINESEEKIQIRETAKMSKMKLQDALDGCKQIQFMAKR